MQAADNQAAFYQFIDVGHPVVKVKSAAFTRIRAAPSPTVLHVFRLTMLTPIGAQRQCGRFPNAGAAPVTIATLPCQTSSRDILHLAFPNFGCCAHVRVSHV